MDENSEVEPSVDNGTIEYEGDEDTESVVDEEVEESEDSDDETNDSKGAGTFYSIE